MSTLFDLCSKPFSEVPSEELQELLRNIRRNRRTPPTVVKKETKAKSKTKSAKDMTPAEAADLLKLLEGM